MAVTIVLPATAVADRSATKADAKAERARAIRAMDPSMVPVRIMLMIVIFQVGVVILICNVRQTGPPMEIPVHTMFLEHVNRIQGVVAPPIAMVPTDQSISRPAPIA